MAGPNGPADFCVDFMHKQYSSLLVKYLVKLLTKKQKCDTIKVV